MATRGGARGAAGAAAATRAAIATLLMLAPAVGQQDYSRDMVVRQYGDSAVGARMQPLRAKLSATTTASLGLGFSEYYGAGGAATLQAGISTQLRINSLYPGFGATGDWATQPRIRVKIEQKVTVEVEDPTLEMVLTQLWAGAILRDNMVTVFGYVLHLPNNPLPADLYTSLFYIYTDVRYRRIQVVEMVDCLPKMAFASAHAQFLILFQELRTVCPKYLSGAVLVWLEALKKKTIDMDKLLLQKNEPVTVDFLAGIEPSVMPILAREIKFPPQAVKAASPESRAVLGKTLSLVMGAVAAGALPLTQPLFALILLHRPVNHMIPQREETERYIVDVLRSNNVENWEEVIKAIRPHMKKGAYAVGRAALMKISTLQTVDRLIRMKARYILQYMKLPIATYANPDYELSSQILSTPSVNILLILKAITRNEYPKEVIAIRDRLEHYILKGYIDTEFIIKGFNRFDHVKPINILIALLTRIEVRIPNLPREIMDCVRYLKQVLIYKKYLSNLNPMVPLYFVDVEAIMNGFSGPFVPQHVVKTVRVLVESLTYESLPWAAIIQTITVQDCSLPRLCLLSVFRRAILVGKLRGSPLESTIIKLIKMLDYKGDPLPGFIVGSQINANETNGQGTSVLRKIVKRESRPGKCCLEAIDLKKIASNETAHREIIKYSKYPRDELIRYFSKAEQPEMLYFPSKTIVVTAKRFYPGPTVENVFTPIPEQVLQQPVGNIKSIHTIIPRARVGTKEDMMLRPIRYLLSHQKLYEFLGSDFNPKAFKTKGQLLRAVLQRLLTIRFVQFNRVLYSTIAKYLQFLETQNLLKVIADESVPFPKITVTFLEQAPDYDNLLSLLPRVQKGTREYMKIYIILEILGDPHLPKLLGPGFVWTNYRTRGRLLIEVLHRVSRLNYIRVDSLRMMTITRFIEHVEDSFIPRDIVLRAPFPEMSVIFENEPAPQLSIESVLPVTIPGTAIHVRLRPLRKFLARDDILLILPDLNPRLYRKKGELLRAVINKCQKSKQVARYPKLHTVVREYWAYLTRVDTKVSRTRITINHRTILYALPPPKTQEEMTMLYVMRDYMSRPDFQSKVVNIINLKVHRTRGRALKVILEKLTFRKITLGNETVYRSFAYYKNKVQMHGYGAQALDVIVSRERNAKFRFEVFSLFRALDHARLPAAVKMSVTRIIKFFTTNFQPSVYLSSFQYARYTTKGTFLRGLMQTLLVQGTVRPDIKADIVHVYPYIITTGPGAEKVDTGPTRPGPNVHIIYL